MKRSTMILLALAGVVYGFLPGSGTGLLGLASKPFILIGEGLRWLSLRGAVGNGVAIVLYVLVCLSPMLLKWKRKWQSGDWLLVLACGLMFWVMHQIVHPNVMTGLFSGDNGQMLYSGSVLSVLSGWAVLKLMRASETVRQENIYKALRIFLLICAAQFILKAFSRGISQFRMVQEYAKEGLYLPSEYAVSACVLSFLVMASLVMEYCFDAAILLRGVELLNELEGNPYSESCCQAADALSNLCRHALICVTLVNMALNVGQVLLAEYIHSIAVSVRFPAMSIALAFGALALARLLSQGRELKEDNDLFI